MTRLYSLLADLRDGGGVGRTGILWLEVLRDECPQYLADFYGGSGSISDHLIGSDAPVTIEEVISVNRLRVTYRGEAYFLCTDLDPYMPNSRPFTSDPIVLGEGVEIFKQRIGMNHPTKLNFSTYVVRHIK